MGQKSKEFNHENELKNEALEKKDIKLEEEKITGVAAIRFYNLLKNPPKDSKKEQIIEEALRLFPNPEKSTKVDIKL